MLHSLQIVSLKLGCSMGRKVVLLYHCQGWGGPANLHMDQFSVQTIKYGRNMTNVDFDSGRMLKTIA